MQEGETGMKNKKAENAITAVLAAAVLVTGGMSLHSYLSEQRAKNEYDAIRQEVVAEPAAGETQEEIAEKNYPELQIDFAELIRTNQDFRGWLYFPVLDISYPVVQGTDNAYYLHHLFTGEYNSSGSIFADWHNQPDFADPNTIVYGHNMKNGSMFGTLREFQNQETYDKNPYFWIFTPDFIYQYRIFSSSEVYKIGDPYRTRFTTEDFQNYIDQSLANSNINCGVQVTTDDRIVTLSTCTADDSTRRIVQGKLEQVYISYKG